LGHRCAATLVAGRPCLPVGRHQPGSVL